MEHEADEQSEGRVKTSAARRQAMALMIQLFRRAIDQTRAYGKGHPMAETATQRFREQFAVVSIEETDLEITMAGVAHDEELLIGRPGQREPLTQALFNEGIRRIVIGALPPDHERDAFFDAWMEIVIRPNEAEALSTCVWELELEAFRLVVLDTFSLTNGESSEDMALQMRTKQELDWLLNAMVAESSASDAGLTLLRVSSDDVAVLRSELVRGVTAEQLAREDSRLAELQLAPEEVERFVQSFPPRSEAVPAAARALVNAAVLAQGEDLEHYGRRIADLFAALAERGRFLPPLAAWKSMVADARADALHGAVRVKLLTALKPFFASAAFLGPLLKKVDTTDGKAPEALDALRIVGPMLGNSLKDQIPRLRSPAARSAVSMLLAEIAPGQATASVNVADLTAEAFAELVKLLDSMPHEESTRLISQGMMHADVHVRREAAAAITPTVAVRLARPVLARGLKDSDAAVRATMLQVVSDLEDPSTAPALGQLLKRPDLEEDERVRVYHALGKVGGRGAAEVLAAELSRKQSPEALLIAINALAALGDPSSAKALEALADKLLLSSRIKVAARAALARVRNA